MKKGIRQIRLCRFCGNQVKENWYNGVFKGYHRTCGNCDFRTGKNNSFYGKKHTRKSLKKMRKAHKGEIPWNKGKKGLQKNLFIGKFNKLHRGPKHWRWKGTTPLIIAIRTSTKYKEWRKAVYERDNYTCVGCGVKGNGRNLNAHHIKPLSIIITENNIKTLEQALNCEEIWDIDNGQTLCLKCHYKTDTYANKIKEYKK